MSDYTISKKFGTNAYPVSSKATSGLFRRVEPLLTPDLMASRYLHGIDVTDYSYEELKQEIELAYNEMELMTGLTFDKVQHKERKPFDRDLYKSFVFMKVDNGPVLSVEDMSIESSNGEQIYRLPPDWIEMGNASTMRQINLIPLLSVFGASGLRDGQPSNAGLIFIQAVNNFQWMPAFFSITYTTGVCHEEGQVPVVINDLIGLTVAMEILSAKQNLLTYNSTSISQDGISQSASGQGVQTYQNRINMLQQKQQTLLKKIKAEFGMKYFLSNV